MAFQRHRFVFCFFLFTWSIILLYSEYMSMLKAKCLTVSETPFLTDGCMAKLCRLENTSQASAQRCERKTGLSLYLRSDSTFCHFFCTYGRAQHHGDREYGHNLHSHSTSLEVHSAFSQVLGKRWSQGRALIILQHGRRTAEGGPTCTLENKESDSLVARRARLFVVLGWRGKKSKKKILSASV